MASSNDRARDQKDAVTQRGKRPASKRGSRSAPKKSSPKPQTTPKRQPKREADAQFGRFRVSWMLVVVAGIIVLGALTLAPSISLLIEQRQDIAALEAEVAEQETEVSELQDQVAQWDDPAYVEAQARDRLFFVYPGETSYVVLDDRSEVDQAGTQTQYSADLEQGQQDWVSAGISSLVGAGLTDDAPEELLPAEPAPTGSPQPTESPVPDEETTP